MAVAATVNLEAVAGHEAAAFPQIDPNNHVVMLDNCELRLLVDQHLHPLTALPDPANAVDRRR